MKKSTLFAAGILLLFMAACNRKPEQKTDLSSNPFMHASTLPFQAPDFTKIKNSDFSPAFEEGIRIQLAEIDSIAKNPEPPTFENTLVALEKSGQLLRRVNGVFNMLSGANTDSVLQKLSEEIAPKLASIQDAVYLNDALYDRFKKIYEKKDQLNLDKESARLLEYYNKQFYGQVQIYLRKINQS